MDEVDSTPARRPRPGALLVLALLAACACDRPDHIEIEPRMPELRRRGELLRLQALLVDRSGRVFSRERTHWSSRDPFIAAVDEGGQVAALASGHTVLTARWNELSAEVPLEVVLVEAISVEPRAVELKASGEPLALRVAALGLGGRPLPGREVRLVSQAPQVARVDAQGRIWPLGPGTTQVVAAVDDQEVLIPVKVLRAR